MKKLIVLSVIFALLASAAFAGDISVSGAVFGTVNVLEGTTGNLADDGVDSSGDAKFKAPDAVANGGMNRIRIEAKGENDDATFGAWFRADTGGLNGLAWWKPMDMLKLTIGGNPDGIFGKEGVTGWMFYQTPSDTGVVQAGNVWGGGYYHTGLIFRNAFYGGFGGQGLLIELTPTDMFGINIVVPYMQGSSWGYNDEDYNLIMTGANPGDVYKYAVVQADVKLDFGNIALTYRGSDNDYDGAGGSTFFLYAGISAIENLDLDVGLGYTLAVDKEAEIMGVKTKSTKQDPITAGLGVKYDMGDFKIKFRTVASFGGVGTTDAPVVGKVEVKEPFKLKADVLPFFAVSETVTAFLSIGVSYVAEVENEVTVAGVTGKVKSDSVFGFHVNPYIQIGSDWGPKFLAGIQFWTDGASYDKAGKDGDPAGKNKGSTYFNWAIPIAIQVEF